MTKEWSAERVRRRGCLFQPVKLVNDGPLDFAAVGNFPEGFWEICGTRSFPPRNSAGFEWSVRHN